MDIFTGDVSEKQETFTQVLKAGDSVDTVQGNGKAKGKGKSKGSENEEIDLF